MIEDLTDRGFLAGIRIDDGLLENPIMADLVRTAPVAVTGEILSYSFDRENNVFTLE